MLIKVITTILTSTMTGNIQKQDQPEIATETTVYYFLGIAFRKDITQYKILKPSIRPEFQCIPPGVIVDKS